jgi:SAM-dependent methyltransferase
MKFAPYDQIAGEYYDAFHKTCRNFDQTTFKALTSVRSLLPQSGLILDIGSGKGRCVEFLGVDANRIIQLDNSRAMLDLSPREECLIRIQHDAEQLPFLSKEFSCVTAFLCDPYLGLDFLAEAYRVLRTSGLLLATTPAYEWGTALRRGISIDSSETRFKTLAGSEIRVPSVLVPRDRLVEMLRRVGFVSEIQVQPHRLPEDAAPLSDDITIAADVLKCGVHELDLLYLVIARK